MSASAAPSDDFTPDETAALSNLSADRAAIEGDTAQIDTQLSRLTGQVDQEQKAAGAAEAGVEGVAGQRAAAMSQPFTQSPPKQDTNLLQGVAPLLLISAFGGKAMKLNAGAMLGATTGMVTGYFQGKEEQFADAQKQYQQAFEAFKQRKADMDKMYQVYQDAYKGRLDYQQKALDATLHSMDEQTNKRRMTIEDKTRIDEAWAKIEEQHTARQDSNWYKDAILKLQNDKLNDAEKKAQAKIDADAKNKLEPAAAAILGEAAAQGVSLPSGTRSVKVINTTLNALADKYPDKSPAEIVSMIREGQIDMKAAMTEATVVARKEANVEGAIQTLNAPGGLYEQLDKAAKLVDLGSSKTMNDLRLASQGKAVANPGIQVYRNLLADTKAELTQVLSRSGQPTDAVRQQANELFPMNMSYAELRASIAASKKVADAINSGNQAVMDTLKNGGSVRDAVAVADSPSAAAASVDPPPAPPKPPVLPTDKPNTVNWANLP